MAYRASQGEPFLVEYVDNGFGGARTDVLRAEADVSKAGSTPTIAVGAVGVPLDLKGTVTINGSAVATVGNSDADLLGTYIVKTATNKPPNAQVLGSLATGIVKNTTTTGALSIAVLNTDYTSPAFTLTGDLGGTLAAPTVLAIHETSGPTKLTVGALADGVILARSGSTLVAASAQAAAGTTSGFTVATGTAVLAGSTFTGNVGASAYTIGDIVKALKALKLLDQ